MPKDNGKSNTLKTVSFDTFYTHFDLKVNRKRMKCVLVSTVFVEKLSQIDVKIRGYSAIKINEYIEINKKKER